MAEFNPAILDSPKIPKNMHLSERSSQLDFRYSWFKVKYLIAVIVTPLFGYFMIKSDYISGNFQEFTIPVIILLLAALVITYYSVAKLLNTTKIRVSNKSISVKHGPVPFSRNVFLTKEQVTQLYVTQHRIGHRYYLYATTYQVNVILSNKDVITLVKGLHSAEQGRFIEHKIEDFLNITDIHVEGELAKD